MTNLKNSTKNQIKNEINQSKHFTIEDFEFLFPSGGNILVKIIFIPYQTYKFIIQEVKKERKKETKSTLKLSLSSAYEYDVEEVIQVVQSPGSYKNKEITEHHTITSCIYQIKNWLYNIQDELSTQHTQTTTNSHKSFQKILEEKFPDDEERFTQEEINKITQKLTKLQKRVDQLEKELKITSKEKEEIQEIITQSQTNLQTYPKKSWYFTTLNKFKAINNDIDILIKFKNNISSLIEFFQ